MIHYKIIKVIINAHNPADVIIDVIVRYNSLSNSIINNYDSVFILKFWSLLCSFLSIKQRLSSTFQPRLTGK